MIRSSWKQHKDREQLQEVPVTPLVAQHATLLLE
jgi:hypothetical protein